MLMKWEVTLPTLTGKRPRQAYIWLPDSYEEDESKRYPVLYMFDGHNLFSDEEATYGKSWGLEEYMDFTGTELIIAAVECNHSTSNGRLKEYSPFDFNGITGGVDDSDELIHGLTLVIKAQFLPHGQVVADLCIVSFLMKL